LTFILIFVFHYFSMSIYICITIGVRVRVLVFQQYFSYIVTVSIIVEETRPVQVTDTLYHIMLYWVHILPSAGFKLATSVVKGTDCICNCKSNYHTITTTTVPVSTLEIQLSRGGGMARHKPVKLCHICVPV